LIIDLLVKPGIGYIMLRYNIHGAALVKILLAVRSPLKPNTRT